MKSHIPNISFTHKPKQSKPNSKSQQSIQTKKENLCSKVPQHFPSVISNRSLSVLKPREKYSRLDSRSVEPPDYSYAKTRSPEPFSPLHSINQNSSINADIDYQRLEYLVNKNNSARKNLLSVQQQIINLNTNQKLRHKKQILPEIDENINYEDINKPNLTSKLDLKIQYIRSKRNILSSRLLFKLPPLEKEIS